MELKEKVDIIIENIGGKNNIINVSNCATRLRFDLKDTDKVNKEEIEKLDGVVGTNLVGKQCQVIVGGDVIKYFPLVQAALRGINSTVEVKKVRSLKGMIEDLLGYIAGTMTPLIPAFIGCSMIRVILTLGTTFEFMDATSSTYVILYAMSNAVFYFLPILAAFSAAQKLNVNPYIAACISAVLMEPSFTSLMVNTGDTVSFIGLPVMMFDYASSLFPALLATWAYAKFYKFLNKKIPGSISPVVTPLLCILICAPFAMLVFGPIAYYIGTWIGNLFGGLIGISPILAGIVIGASMQFLTITGLHWVVTTIVLVQFANTGVSTILGLWWWSCLACHAIALGSLLIAKTKEERNVAISCCISMFLAGVAEPTLFTYLLRNKKYIIPVIASGAIGGAIGGFLGTEAMAFVFPAIFSLPVILTGGSWITTCVVSVIEIAIGAGLVVLLVKSKDRLAISSPINGKIIPMTSVNDAVFASESLGDGIAIVPQDNKVYAPFDAEVVALYPTKHAIGLKNADDVEILIHIGIDTVNANGEGFTTHVNIGDKVRKGELLIEFDLQLLQSKNYDMTTIILFTNSKNIDKVENLNARTNADLAYIE